MAWDSWREEDMAINGADAKQLYRDRVEVAVELWDKVLRGEVVSRAQLEELLYIKYKQRGIEPFRGLSRIRIYDKEIATIYVVGRYGLGIVDEDLAKSLRGIFNVEVACDEVYQLLKATGFNPQGDLATKVRESIANLPGQSLEDKAFRCLRLIFTGALMGLLPEEDLVASYRALSSVLEELGGKLVNYVRFYVAFRVAEQIALGQIRSIDEKKIIKYAYCIKLNVNGCVPSERLIREVALRVYKVPKRVVDKLFPNQGPQSYVPKAT